MEGWTGKNIIDLVRVIVNEDDLPVEEKHIEFSVQRDTFEEVRKALIADLEAIRISPVWSKSSPKETFRDKIISLEIEDGVPSAVPVIMELSLRELESINTVLRYQIESEQAKNKLPYDLMDAFINLNHDFQMAGGMTSSTFENCVKD